MKLPSERIESWRKFFKRNRLNETPLENTLSAIITFLDEQAKENHPYNETNSFGGMDFIETMCKEKCLHKSKKNIDRGNVGYIICNNCGEAV